VRSPRLILVYNADRGLFSAAAGWAHKWLSPDTYTCALCKVSYGATGMLPAWRDYLATVSFPVEFLYRDTFQERYGMHREWPLPAIFVDDDALEILLSAKEIEEAGGLAGLILRLDGKLADLRT
jgi:hypothetical protein